VWKLKRYNRKINHHHNFGDYLSLLIIKSITNSRVLLADQHDQAKLLAIGSILWSLQDQDVIWGAGAHHPNQIPHRDHVRCLAVRGPLTLRELKLAGVVSSDCQPVFFDPGILTPLLFPDITRKQKVKERVTIIPHYADIAKVKSWQTHSPATKSGNIHIANPFWHPLKVATQIAQSETVISSSLHGLILADALGVPSIPLRLDGCKEPMLKYEDYYQGFGRVLPRFSTDIDEALRREPISFSYKREDLTRCLASFPFAMKDTVKQMLGPQPAAF
jgi:pyruvyltransferase